MWSLINAADGRRRVGFWLGGEVVGYSPLSVLAVGVWKRDCWTVVGESVFSVRLPGLVTSSTPQVFFLESGSSNGSYLTVPFGRLNEK